MKITKRQLRRIIREQLGAGMTVFEADRGGYYIGDRLVPDAELDPAFLAAWESGDVLAQVDHLKKMGVTHIGGDSAWEAASSLGLPAQEEPVVSLKDWLRAWK